MTALANSENGTRTAPQRSPLLVMSQQYNIEANKLMEVLRGTVIKPDRSGRAATNEEVAAFTIVANQYGLNPFTREIHAFTDPQRGVVPIVGIDGWSRIINSHSQFDGCDFTDEQDEKGNPLSITCVMYVKGRSHPISIKERFKECYRNTKPWDSMPWRMLRHKAFMQTGRIAFSISGLYDEDEARDIVDGSVVPTQAPPKTTVTSASAVVDKIKGRTLPAPATPAAPIEQQPIHIDPPAESNAIPEDPRDNQQNEPVIEQHVEQQAEPDRQLPDVSTWSTFTDFMTDEAAGKIAPDVFNETMKTLKLGNAGSGRAVGTKARIDIAEAVMDGKFDWNTASIMS